LVKRFRHENKTVAFTNYSYHICPFVNSIGIDPEDDVKDPDLMKGLEEFLEEEMTEEERRNFLDNTVRIMVNRALHLKRWRPPKGLMFSLQQQS
jgi:hypothetical protein